MLQAIRAEDVALLIGGAAKELEHVSMQNGFLQQVGGEPGVRFLEP